MGCWRSWPPRPRRLASQPRARPTPRWSLRRPPDPLLLDPSLVSDGEEWITDQVFRAWWGTAQGRPGFSPSSRRAVGDPNGLVWTFNLRRNVRFQDGLVQRRRRLLQLQPLVQLPVPLQSGLLSYYWITVFGGFAKPGPDAPGPAKASTGAVAP